MKKVSHEESFARAANPLDVVHMDVVSVSLMDLPAGVDGSKLGMRYGLVCVDDHSRLKRVYFSKKKGEVLGLIHLFLLEMGTHVLFGSHFVLHNGFQQLRIHTDGGGELNSAAVDEILLAFGLSANVQSTRHTPLSNGVAERHIQSDTGSGCNCPAGYEWIAQAPVALCNVARVQHAQ
jgi:hypothetical protein